METLVPVDEIINSGNDDSLADGTFSLTVKVKADGEEHNVKVTVSQFETPGLAVLALHTIGNSEALLSAIYEELGGDLSPDDDEDDDDE